MGIRDLRKFNYALLEKWRWNLFHNQGDLWARLLISKYGGWRTLDGERRGSSESAWWKDINRIAHSGEDGSWLDKGIKWTVGCGAKAKFWEDGVSLRLKYPTLYSMSYQQHVIQQMGRFTTAGWEWDFQWRRQLFDDEIDMAAKFLEE